MSEPGLTLAGAQPPEWLTAKPSKCCARCGEPDRHFVTIDDKDYCETCKAIVRLNEFHRLVTGEGSE